MIYQKQTRDACLAYALLQVGRVSKAAVRRYEQRIEDGFGVSFGDVEPWLAKYAPEVYNSWRKLIGFPLPKKSVAIPDGTGILFLQGDTLRSRMFHAVSYEDGWLMDPAQDAPGRAESWQELKKRYAKDGISTIIINAFPTKG